jgi:hypothetical protein
MTDGSRFDTLARSVAGATHRRGFVGSLAALAAGLAGIGTAGAACPPEQVARRGFGCVCRATGRPPGPEGCPCGRTRETCTAGEVCAPAEGGGIACCLPPGSVLEGGCNTFETIFRCCPHGPLFNTYTCNLDLDVCCNESGCGEAG